MSVGSPSASTISRSMSLFSRNSPRAPDPNSSISTGLKRSRICSSARSRRSGAGSPSPRFQVASFIEALPARASWAPALVGLVSLERAPSTPAATLLSSSLSQPGSRTDAPLLRGSSRSAATLKGRPKGRDRPRSGGNEPGVSSLQMPTTMQSSLARRSSCGSTEENPALMCYIRRLSGPRSCAAPIRERCSAAAPWCARSPCCRQPCAGPVCQSPPTAWAGSATARR